MSPNYTRGGLATALCIVFLVGLLVGYASGSGQIPSVEKYQTLIGATVAVAAAWITWTNVRKQMRVNLMSREEDRLERELPGLEEAAYWLTSIWFRVNGAEPGEIRGRLAEAGVPADKDLDEQIKIRLPQADYILRQQVSRELSGLLFQTTLYLIGRDSLQTVRDAGREPSDEELAGLEKADARTRAKLESFREFCTGISRRLGETERSLDSFRSELKEHFA